ncbi:predicted protein [Pyrenophora tritici-repentis Pt-1C-BFP]|uniref:Uncharacterized protein n=1 Tax=Pyrenophora tritici-repentis (strain Pt-1C-BFP) TaxID=426418 RepID=B2WGH0_PYRTR|nr:uncharacterized protein PTRG_09026 [Pyrenophora tritici-repentis Pt-1C-BFP]EDU42077.1 predicted protein [Pyrenophora tritici-repentis Pt-1C-BFP]
MKAIGYLVAGAALIPGLVSALDPNNITGWRYRGCYSDKRFTNTAACWLPLDDPSPAAASLWHIRLPPYPKRATSTVSTPTEDQSAQPRAQTLVSDTPVQTTTCASVTTPSQSTEQAQTAPTRTVFPTQITRSVSSAAEVI